MSNEQVRDGLAKLVVDLLHHEEGKPIYLSEFAVSMLTTTCMFFIKNLADDGGVLVKSITSLGSALLMEHMKRVAIGEEDVDAIEKIKIVEKYIDEAVEEQNHIMAGSILAKNMNDASKPTN